MDSTNLPAHVMEKNDRRLKYIPGHYLAGNTAINPFATELKQHADGHPCELKITRIRGVSDALSSPEALEDLIRLLILSLFEMYVRDDAGKQMEASHLNIVHGLNRRTVIVVSSEQAQLWLLENEPLSEDQVEILILGLITDLRQACGTRSSYEEARARLKEYLDDQYKYLSGVIERHAYFTKTPEKTAKPATYKRRTVRRVKK